jgi:hypothetical protein
VEQQAGEQHRLAPRSERDRLAVFDDFERSQNAKFRRLPSSTRARFGASES